MSQELARILYETGRAHGLSAERLYHASLQYAVDKDLPKPDHFAFNGTFSLSVYYLIGLGLELFLKAAVVLNQEGADLKFLKNHIGHDLIVALETAEANGFSSNAPNLRDIAEHLREPFMKHFFRYERPDVMPLPEITQVIEMFAVLDEEFETLFDLQN